MTEAQLIADCQRNDRKAQKVLYDRYSRAMFSTTFRLLGDTDLAAEALQDGFLQVFTHIGGFEGRSTLGAWIKKIMVRTAIGSLRKKRLRTLLASQTSFQTTGS